MSNKQQSDRLIASGIIQKILNQQGSLSSHLPVNEATHPAVNNSLVQALCFGVCRYFFRLEFILSQLLDKPLRAKDQDIYCLLLVSLFQLFFMDKPEHAIVNESVKDVVGLRKLWAKGLINALLREAIRQKANLDNRADENELARYSYPLWLVQAIRESWPDSYQQILEAGNLHPPMTLRVNFSKITREDYLEKLSINGIQAYPGALCNTAIILEQPCPVQNLPGFTDGLISVQDEASQLASTLLPRSESACSILDACAAPGGKSSAILEQFPEATRLTAIDSEAHRLPRIHENFSRLNLNGKVIHGDMTSPQEWWDGELYDLILVDAPCSATGVIRRHPDIKILRQHSDIQKLCLLQALILIQAWTMLKPGGYLLYSTCSLLKEENTQQIADFIQQNTNAEHIPLSLNSGESCEFGWQLLPDKSNHDGFYYALLQKC